MHEIELIWNCSGVAKTRKKAHATIGVSVSVEAAVFSKKNEQMKNKEKTANQHIKSAYRIYITSTTAQ